MKTVGILGGGQLGWMLSESLFKYGASPRVLTNQRSLATDRIPGTIVGSWSDPDVLQQFFDECDIVTIEVEHVDVDALEPYADRMAPSLEVIRMAQHRVVEKTFLREQHVPHAWWTQLTSAEQARSLADELVFPLIAKTALGGYDGLGQYAVADRTEFVALIEELDDAIETFGVVLEEPLDLSCEASVILARSPAGTVEFPVFENHHRHHVLDQTFLPANLSDELTTAMQEIARRAADAMDLHGMLTTEFFITNKPGRAGGLHVGDHYLFVNEFAPRPHNSGHISRNACSLSQFDALARALLGLPAEPPQVLSGRWCMANLLSDLWGDRTTLDLAAGLARGGVVDVVLYGKRPTRPARKMGHVVAHGKSREDVSAAVDAFRRDV